MTKFGENCDDQFFNLINNIPRPLVLKPNSWTYASYNMTTSNASYLFIINPKMEEMNVAGISFYFKDYNLGSKPNFKDQWEIFQNEFDE